MARNEDNNGNRANNGRSSGGSRNNGDGSGFKWNLVVKLGVLARYSNGWTKELNIRDWDETHDHMSRGITLHREEAAKLYRLLGNQF